MKTKLPWTVAVTLWLLLLLSNGFWIYKAIDHGVTQTYQTDNLRMHCLALKSCMSLTPTLARDMTRAQVLAAARSTLADDHEFENDGAVWRGHLGLQFQSDRLAAVLPTWDPFECPE